MAASSVQHRSTFSNGTTSLALAYASNNTLHNLLVYITMGTSGASSAATDNNTNTIANAVALASGHNNNRIDYVQDAKSGANTVTGHSSASADIHLHIWEITGCVNSSALRDTGTVSSNSTGSVSTSGSTTQAGDAVLACFDDEFANDTLTADAGAAANEKTNNGTGLDAALSEFKAASASGTQTMTCGGNGTNQLGQAIATFVASGISVGEMAAAQQWGQIQPVLERKQIVDY